MAWGLSLVGGVRMILGWVVWWVVLGVILVTWFLVTFYMAVWRIRGTLPALEVHASSWFSMHFALAFWLVSKTQQKNTKTNQNKVKRRRRQKRHLIHLLLSYLGSILTHYFGVSNLV